MSDPALPAYRYTIDADDRVTSVSDSWLEFSGENGAGDLTRESVVGRSLWSFITGEETRELYRAIFERVRAHDTPLIVPFRCDSPEFRRSMRLVISPIANRGLQLDGVLIRKEPRVYMGVLDPACARSTESVRMCSGCKRVLVRNREWLEVEDAVVRLKLFSDARKPRIVHALCGDCRRMALPGVAPGPAA